MEAVIIVTQIRVHGGRSTLALYWDDASIINSNMTTDHYILQTIIIKHKSEGNTCDIYSNALGRCSFVVSPLSIGPFIVFDDAQSITSEKPRIMPCTTNVLCDMWLKRCAIYWRFSEVDANHFDRLSHFRFSVFFCAA